MSIDQFHPIINNLKGQAEALESESTALTGSMQGRKISKESVEGSHRRILEAFRKAMNETHSLKEQIHKATTWSNQEQLIFIVEEAIALETRLEKALTRLNSHLLTFYPTAGIDYGKSCIGSVMPPVSQENDVKFQNMLKNFTGVRDIRGDGNCFVASFTTRFIENLMDQNAIGNFILFLYEDDVGSPEIKNEMLSTLMSLQQYPSQLEKILGDNQKILPFISYFRHLAADEMKRNPEQFEICFRADLEDVYKEETAGRSLAVLIDQYVIPMGIDLSQPMITALCQRMKFPVRIFDSKAGHPEGFNVLDGQAPMATFCRRGAHYFVLYTPNELKPLQAAPHPSPIGQSRQIKEIVVRCHVPFGHNLFIRGSNNGLNWDRGIPLTQVADDTWVFRSITPLEDIDYKFLIDDQIWENGANHRMSHGLMDVSPPQFTLPSNMDIQDPHPTPARETRITVRFLTKPGEKLFIRGAGPNMSWDKGNELRNIGDDLWIFETRGDFKNLEYKILLNDTNWELNGNHTTECGKKEEITPQFHHP